MQVMHCTSISATESHAPAPFEPGALLAEIAQLREQLVAKQHQNEVYRKLLFGPRSEKRPFDIPGQGTLFEGSAIQSDVDEPKQKVEYERGKAKKKRPEGCVNSEGLRFDDGVPVKTIHLSPEGIEGLSCEEYEIIGTREFCKLAQTPASYTILRYEQPVVKLKSSGSILPLVPVPALFDRSIADVSLGAGILCDKFVSHLPLYRQHQRMEAAGVTIARSTMTLIVKRTIELLEPIAEAQWRRVLLSKVLTMDETPIKAGKSKTRKGRMHQGYFWPIYGEDDEIVFTYSDSRARRVIEEILGKEFKGVLLSDGYKAYASFCARNESIIHAQCWVHTRRQFVDARDQEPVFVDEILEMIGTLYAVEKTIRKEGLEGQAKLERRRTLSAPVVERIFAWVKERVEDPSLVPSNPFTKALGYLRERQVALSVFLDNPDVPLDTNHLERGLRPIPMGRRAWNFCWTELGAEHVGIIQTLISTCKLQDVDPYTYLVDVLQRVGEHPAADIIELTPRVWKTKFADNPLRSDIYDSG